MLTDFLKSGGFDAYVIVSESVNSADMYYATGFLAHDPFACVCGEPDFILISEMELGRAGKESRVADIRTTSGYGFMEKYRSSKDADTAYAEVLAEALSRRSKIAVPKSFPVYLADSLRRYGFDVVPVKSPLHKMREVKTEEEVCEIERTQRAAESAMAAALAALAASEERRGELYLGGARLTSESMRALIEKTLLEQGCEASNTIVACGTASSDPHSTGAGVLTADEPIVIDMVPRRSKSRYYTDMTRTFVRGDAPPELAEMYDAVRDAQETAFDMIRA
ncbi:MAG TPA: M24 family metallopeptidase, partial [Candidatus Methanoperedenaceae archaeon]|nr:M24 family metallopeptidase [Candidatus Methanoperedenaceae archaeon]